MKDLPDNIVNLEVVRINRNIEKRCKCRERDFVVDPQNREICCGNCGARVDPFDAMNELATHYERFAQETERLYQQRKEIASYKPWLVTIRKLEQQYRGRKMLPCCPNCKEAFYLEEITTWSSAEYVKAKRSKEQNKRQ